MINKKSQIPSTLTWFAAFIIIFFIILLFISASIIVSARKSVNSINFQEYGGSLKSQRSSIVLLNSKINGMSFEDYIKNNLGTDYKDLFESAVDIFKETDLLWRIFIFNPDGGYATLTKKEWDRKTFDCYNGESYMEFNFLDLNNKKLIVQVQVCDGKISKEAQSFQWSK